jgi:hypothetical protein
VGNAFRQGFYWPTAVADATRIVRSCQGCQFYARQTHLPAQALLKGKCAFGPFLSILVIECKHKCLNVKICPRMNKVQITIKGMFLSLSTLVLCTNILSKC